MTKRAVVLLSGGLDSTVGLALAMEDGWGIDCAITFDYGQRAAHAERRQTSRLCAHYEIRHHILELPWFKDFKKSALLDHSRELPNPTYSDLDNPDVTQPSASAVWVPNRNGAFIEIAASFAEAHDATGIIVGFNREEAATFPDNSVEYLAALNRALSFSTLNDTHVMAPTSHMNKKQIVYAALRLNVPLQLIWSCYEDAERMCGRCESCRRLGRALKQNGIANETYFANPAFLE